MIIVTTAASTTIALSTDLHLTIFVEKVEHCKKS